MGQMDQSLAKIVSAGSGEGDQGQRATAQAAARSDRKQTTVSPPWRFAAYSD